MDHDRSQSDLGATLRAARERRGVSLRAIADRTKISASVLEALERNDISRLPGGIFGRAFVRSYAIEVGLDPEEIIEQFLAQFPHETVTAGHPRSDQIEDSEALESDRQFALALLRLAGISVPIVAALLYFGPGGHRLVPSRAPSALAVLPASPLPQDPQPARAADPEGPTDPAVSPASAATASEEPAAQARVPIAPAVEPASNPSPPSDADRMSVGLTATRRCWVSATVDGRVALARELTAGEEATLNVARALVLKAGDAGAIAMKVNGVAARSLGRDGEVVTVRLDLANYRTFLSPR